MTKRLTMIAMLSLAPAPLLAQAAAQPTGVVRSAEMAEPTAVCDGSVMRSAERRRLLGNALMLGAVVGGTVGFSATHNDPRAGASLVASTMAVGLLGAILRGTAYPSQSFWESTLARMHVGETTRLQVETCLHQPNALSTSGTEEQLTYFTKAPLLTANTASVHSVSFTFRDGLLAEIRRSRLRY